jgi:hypothetical protein
VRQAGLVGYRRFWKIIFTAESSVLRPHVWQGLSSMNGTWNAVYNFFM